MYLSSSRSMEGTELILKMPPYLFERSASQRVRCHNNVGDLCRFTIHEVFNRRGEFFDHDDILAIDEKYLPLIEWEYHHV
ncbi:hypothetical protein U9M48_012754 [Paspalum notatum var. saurae]|uniref:Uncharacterized protein n=1 Tax=Paspalum notatum var. saurae TaxID=547442 RepID=A0AAQ3SY88_PASNO